MPTPRQLADQFQTAYLTARPFEASMDGVPGYDHLVPDASEAGDAAWRSLVEGVLADARAVDRSVLPGPDVVTLDCVVEYAEQELLELDSAAVEHTVTALPFSGPAVLFAVLARTVLDDEAAAADYLARLAGGATWIDQQCERLRSGAASGRLPVAPLVEQAIAWADDVLQHAGPEAVAIPPAPPGWAGAAAWASTRDRVASEVLVPALRRWVALLGELLPVARPGAQAGLVHLPGGDTDYARAIRAHTTLPLTADELHRIGLEEVGALERRAVELGATVGLPDLDAVHAALRASTEEARPATAMAAAEEAVRRAEARAGEVLPPPLPAPCAVAPMPHVVAASGMAPHYTTPHEGGGRPGTYWFNLEYPTGAGWDLEVVAFHEAVPGHHLQLSRALLCVDLPDLQRQRYLSVFGEGWALYAEQLAEEMGLYRDTYGLLGAITDSLLRAARLVVDTGLHAFGWSRAEALDYMVAHVPHPAGYLAPEIDRYIAAPGQALSYLTGKREILAARALARTRQGPDFSLPAFHAALLDSGSLPIPVMHRRIGDWLDGG